MKEICAIRPQGPCYHVVFVSSIVAPRNLGSTRYKDMSQSPTLSSIASGGSESGISSQAWNSLPLARLLTNTTNNAKLMQYTLPPNLDPFENYPFCYRRCQKKSVRRAGSREMQGGHGFFLERTCRRQVIYPTTQDGAAGLDGMSTSNVPGVYRKGKEKGS